MTKILIINVHSSCNAGDEALTLVSIKQLIENFPGAEISVAIDDPTNYAGLEKVLTSIYHWVRSTNTGKLSGWNYSRLLWVIPACLIPLISNRWLKKNIFFLTPSLLHPLIQAYLSADLVVSKPGGFLYSSGHGINLLLALFSMSLAIIAGKPLYIFPQSIGPLQFKWECVLLRSILKRARIVMVREKRATKQLENCDINLSNTQVLPDTAFAFKGASPSEAKRWLNQQGVDFFDDQPLLGITVLNWGAESQLFSQQAEYETAIEAVALYFREHYHGQVIFFTQVWGPSKSQDDRIPLRRIANRLASYKTSIQFIDEPLAPSLLWSLYGQMDAFIGTRMHSNIFALSQGVPAIGIAYQPKTYGIFKMLNMEDWVIDIQNLTAQSIIKLLDQLMSSLTIVKTQLSCNVPIIIQEASVPGKIIAADFAKLKSITNTSH